MEMGSMLNIGLTGGIGSGKSTVAGLFEKKGARIIDFDVLARRVVEPGQPAWKEIVDHFGDDVIDDGGRIDREALATRVFRDREQREKLNGVVHPAIFREWMEDIAAIQREVGEAVIISDIPLLIEVGLQRHMDATILVYASPAVQVRRIMDRNGYSREEAEDRLRAQMNIDDKVHLCDFVIRNEGDLDETQRQVDAVWKELLELQKKKRQPAD
ncbi:MAG: dephospho-CoA kinase [Deltaproteobacteria bacterium]|nr:dephospho-CoA kinase [Deltaproteobacteria bacterium]